MGVEASAADRSPLGDSASRPQLILLGSAQDGGVPHAGCLCANCRAARADARRRRLPASAGVASGEGLVLIDATSAFAEQYHALWSRSGLAGRVTGSRYGAPETIVLTHAHTGHYTGLWQLDRSVLAASGTLVLAPPRTHAFLARQEPWAGMEREGFIRLAPLPLDKPVELLPGITFTAVDVPHRAEWQTDTIGLRIEGPHVSAFYLPDIDAWDAWRHDVRDIVAGVDSALLDGCFWDAPTSRNVPHPPVRETMARLQDIVDRGQTRVAFTHLNHTNPLVDAASIEAHEVRERGYLIGSEGDSFGL
jgi:pyrroloquinoline quinone biosynthesis protein B